MHTVAMLTAAASTADGCVHDVPLQAADLADPRMLLCLSLLAPSQLTMGLPSNNFVSRPHFHCKFYELCFPFSVILMHS